MRRAAGLDRRGAAARGSPAGLDAVAGLGAAAIDAHLARADQFLQMSEGETRIMMLEPAIEAHIRLVLADGDVRNACHGDPR